MQKKPSTQGSTDSADLTPQGFLAGAVRRMPWLKYADAALAVAAIGVIIRSRFEADPFQAFLWALPFLGLMFVLVEFRRHAEGRSSSRVVGFLSWCFALMVVVTVGLLISCHFWPRLCQPAPPSVAKVSDVEVSNPTVVECLTNGNNDNITCPVYQGRFSSATKVEITGTVDEIDTACDPEWRDASLYFLCNDVQSDHKDFLSPRNPDGSGKGLAHWQPPRDGDGTNFSFRCPVQAFQATTAKLTVHPRGCSNVKLTNIKVHSTTE